MFDYGGERMCVREARPLVQALLGEVSVSRLDRAEGPMSFPGETEFQNSRSFFLNWRRGRGAWR